MKTKLPLLLLFLVMSKVANSTVWTINNSGLTFSPNLVTINFGDTVIFSTAINHDAREVSMATWNANGNVALAGGFQTPFGGGFVLPAQLAVGTHYYVCTPHASMGMKGRIVVNPCALPATPGTISGSITVCEGVVGSYSVSAIPGATSYTWSLPSGWTGTSTTTSISAIPGITSGDIIVTANNACGSSSAQTLNVFVESIPLTPSAIVGDTIVCLGAMTTFNAVPVSNATDYIWTLPPLWNGLSNSSTITANVFSGGGIISVAAHNACGTSAVQTLIVYADTVPLSPASITGDVSICNGSAVAYTTDTVSNATFYNWTVPFDWPLTNNGTGINAIAGATSGIVSVAAGNMCGISDTVAIYVIVNTVDVSVSQTGTQLTANATGSLYQWIDCNGNAPVIGEANAVFNPALSGNYAVIVTTNGCTDTSSCYNIIITDIKEKDPAALVLYPNPAEGIVYISGLDKNNVTKVEVINPEGQIVFSERNTNSINLKNFESGLYMIVFVSSEGVIKKKLFLE